MTEKTTLYKVLLNGASMNGGDLKWSLPKRRKDGTWTPGKWHSVKGEIVVCNNGLHLTAEPYTWWQWNADVYEAEGRGDSDTDDGKTAFREARLLRLIERPQWLQNAYGFVDSIKNARWFQQHEAPNPEWKLFLADDIPTARNAAGNAAWNAARDAARDAAGDAAWDAARDAAGDAAWNAARDAARDAAWDAAGNAARDAAWNAALLARIHIVSDLQIDEKHREHALARWEVWTRGYGLLCDVDGVLYVYGVNK